MNLAGGGRQAKRIDCRTCACQQGTAQLVRRQRPSVLHQPSGRSATSCAKARQHRRAHRSFLSISAAMELAWESTDSTAPAAWAVVLPGAAAALMAAGPGRAGAKRAGGGCVGRPAAEQAPRARGGAAGDEGDGQAAAAAGEWAPMRRGVQAACDRSVDHGALPGGVARPRRSEPRPGGGLAVWDVAGAVP